jgi:hypothetical protein
VVEEMGMSGKTKFILVLALIAIGYVLLSGDADPVEVEVEE